MAEPLKDRFTPELMAEMGRVIRSRCPDFDQGLFLAQVFDDQWAGLEVKARLTHVAQALRAAMPGSYPESMDKLMRVTEVPDGFLGLALSEYVALYGLDHWDLSMRGLAWATTLGSAEFAIRPFIRQDQDRAMAQMLAWAADPSLHVRRLASEGCRPRLPWTPPLRRFIADPAPILPILSALKDDPEEYVRRSVANNLNDISKDHPDLVLSLADEWITGSANTKRLVKHALRTLLKAGDTRALRLFGYGDPAHLSVHDLAVTPAAIAIGDSTTISFTLHNAAPAPDKVRLEYAIHYQKKNGTLSKKIFQLREGEVLPGATPFTTTQHFRQLTTRVHYPGLHQLAVHANGVELARINFSLK